MKARREKARVRECLVEAIARGGAAAFLTLNPVLDPGLALRDRITKLLGDFARIRNRRPWRSPDRGYLAQVGLVFALEVGGADPQGHPHLHVLLWGLDHGTVEDAATWLKKAWCELNPAADPGLQTLAMVEPSWDSLDTLSGYLTKGTQISLAWS